MIRQSKILHILFIIFWSLFSPLFSNESSLEKVRLQLQWKHQFEFAGFYMAKEKGYYEALGLDVHFIEFHEDVSLVDTVLDGDAEYALGYASIIADYLNGKPIIFVANFFKQSPLVLVTQKEISSLTQLKNAKVEGIANNIDNMTLYAMLSKFGIKDEDIQTIPPSFTVDAFINKEVEAMSAFTTNELYLLNEKGAQYNVFDPVSYGAKYYDVNLFTSKKELQDNPKRIEKMREASIKGWEYALAHKEEAVALILQKYNSQDKTEDSLLFESKQIEHIMLQKVYQIGSIDVQRVKMMADSFVQSGFVEKSRKNLEKFIFQKHPKDYILSKEEKEYLEKKEYISACVNPDWMPFSAIDGGKYTGVNADFLDIFEEKLGIPIEIEKTDSLKQSFGFAKARRCDLVSMVVPTEEKEQYLNFTVPYFSFMNVLVTKNDERILINIEDLEKKKVALIESHAVASSLKVHYPSIDIIEVKSIVEGLEVLQREDVYGFIDNAFSIDYYFQKEDYSNFKIGSYFNDKSYLSLGIRKDDVLLYSILNKIVSSISKEEKHFIRTKWFTLNTKKETSYELYFQFIVGTILIIFILIYRHYAIKKRNKELTLRVQKELENSKNKDKMIFHQSKLIAMGEMIENIAHQWRQPLSQVNSCVLVIDTTLEQEEFKNAGIDTKLLEIESLTKYMSTTIEDFRNFFSHEKEKSTFFIEDVIDKSLKVLANRIEMQGIQIVQGLATQHSYYGYPNELQQALIVIINNAIDTIIDKEVEQGKVTIDIGLYKNINKITISDNAGGISEDLQNKIFEPYYTTKKKSNGTGLGLYISKIIIEDSLGGTLSMKNNFLGASFVIELENVES